MMSMNISGSYNPKYGDREGKMTEGEKANLVGFGLAFLAMISPPMVVPLIIYTGWYANKGGIVGIDIDAEKQRKAKVSAVAFGGPLSSNRIGVLRRAKALSTNEFCRMTGLSFAELMRIENGEGIWAEDAYRVAQALGMTIYALYELDD